MDLLRSRLFTSSALYCLEDADIFASWNATTGGKYSAVEWTAEIDTSAFDSSLTLLFTAETEHLSSSDYLSRSINSSARQDSINWILKVIDFYRFNPVTAYRSVYYLDRFLSANSLPVAKGHNGQKQSGAGWPMQLLSVACLAIAAKMEETYLPLLSDLQILDPKYVFEPKTIRRMELHLMEALQWRLRTVTPFDFLPYFANSVLPVNRTNILSRAADLIISSRRVVDFLRFRPSTIAAAAALCASDEIAAPSATNNANSLFCFSEWISKEVVGECRQLMEEYLIDACPSLPPGPNSPIGVLDAAECPSSDLDKAFADVVGGGPPPFKRRRFAGAPANLEDDPKSPLR